jgi:hypothetical protein
MEFLGVIGGPKGNLGDIGGPSQGDARGPRGSGKVLAVLLWASGVVLVGFW